MGEPTVVTLDWVGPHRFVGDIGDLEPPGKPGVYLWAVGESPRPSNSLCPVPCICIENPLPKTVRTEVKNPLVYLDPSFPTAD